MAGGYTHQTWEAMQTSMSNKKKSEMRRYNPYDNSTIAPSIANNVRRQLHLRSVIPVTERRPSIRFHKNAKFALIPKSSKIDTNTFQYNMGFKTKPSNENVSQKTHDYTFLSNPNLYKVNRPRGFRDPVDISKGTFYGSHVGSMSGNGIIPV